LSYNGSGTFQINTAGQPVVAGTVISSTAFNSLTADLANGLSTAITKDGQTTVTNNIPMAGFKITGLGAATVGTDAARYSQIQGGTDKLITVTGTDTLTGSLTPALTAYAAGNQFSFVVANTNTGAVTINIDGVGSKSITRTGSTALVAGDMVAGQVVLIEYDGTRFQLLNGNSFTNLNVSGTLGVTGATTLSAALTYGGVTLTNAVTGTGKMVLDTSPTIATPTVTNPTVTNYVESVVAIGTVTSSNTIALTNGTVQTATLTASTACTFTMPTATAGKSFVLLLKQAATTGNGTATFTGVKWGTSGAPTITATAGKMDILTFIADGTNWYGSIAQGYTP
jgi:hypothetical protein